MDKVKEFEKELAYIKNPTIKQFAEKAIEDMPDYIFSISSSSTNKYHPAYALGEGGLIRHMRATIRIAIELFRMEMFAFTNDEKDLILASLAIHDGRKSGAIKQNFTVVDHPLIQTFAMKQNYELTSSLQDDYFTIICENIDTHMGQWNRDYKTKEEILPKPKTKLQKFVHLCDYLASRKCLEMNFDVELSKE